MALPTLLLLFAARAEPVGVSLPDGRGDDWSTRLQTAGLVEVSPDRAAVRIEADGPAWRLLVVGTDRTATVPAPLDAADRDGICWTAASLAEPLWSGPLPPPAPRAAKPAAPAPAAGPTVVVPVYDGSRRRDVAVPATSD